MRRPEGKVRLIQYLCPQRHCIIAGVYIPGECTREECEADLQEKCAQHQLHPWCGICGSQTLTFEEKATPWNSLEEAIPVLLEGQRQQLLSRQLLDTLGQTVDGPGSGGVGLFGSPGKRGDA